MIFIPWAKTLLKIHTVMSCGAVEVRLFALRHVPVLNWIAVLQDFIVHIDICND